MFDMQTKPTCNREVNYQNGMKIFNKIQESDYFSIQILRVSCTRSECERCHWILTVNERPSPMIRSHIRQILEYIILLPIVALRLVCSVTCNITLQSILPGYDNIKMLSIRNLWKTKRNNYVVFHLDLYRYLCGQWRRPRTLWPITVANRKAWSRAPSSRLTWARLWMLQGRVISSRYSNHGNRNM